jgi:hypothetical protein
MNTDLQALLRDAGRTPPPSGIDVTRALDRGRKVRKRRRLAVVAAAAVTLAAGATFALGELPRMDRSPAPGGTVATAGPGADPVLTQLEPNLMQAHLSGVLERSGNCLMLEQATSRVVVAWPPGTRWSADDEVVVLADGSRVGLGDAVSASGGYVAADRAGLNRSLGAEPADRAIRCAKSFGRSVALLGNVTKS